jgi:sulfur carrier protein ThiS
MQISIERTKETFTKNFNGKAKDLLQELNIIAEDVLIIRNGQLVTEEEDLAHDDEIKLLSVISGG